MDGKCAMAGEEQCELASLAQLRNYSAAAPGRKFPDAVSHARAVGSPPPVCAAGLLLTSLRERQVYVYRNIDAAGHEFTELHDALAHHPEWFLHNDAGKPCWIQGAFILEVQS